MSAIAIGLPYYDPALWTCPLCGYDSVTCLCTVPAEDSVTTNEKTELDAIANLIAEVRKAREKEFSDEATRKLAEAAERVEKLRGRK